MGPEGVKLMGFTAKEPAMLELVVTSLKSGFKDLFFP